MNRYPYLMSVPLRDGGHMHCYLVAVDGDDDQLGGALNILLDKADARGVLLPIVTTTPLDSAGEASLHKMFRETIPIPEIWDTYQQSTGYHLSIFELAGSWDDEVLATH